MILRTSLCTFALLCAQTALARDISKITQVILYPGSATIERTAQVNAGAQKLEITQLPANFAIETLRLEADPGISLGEFTVLDRTGESVPNPKQAELEKQIQAIGDQIALIEVERQSAELVTGYLGGLRENPDNVKTTEARQLLSALEAIRNGGQDAYIRIHKAGIQKRNLEKQQALLQSELEKIKGQSRASRNLSVRLASSQSGSVRISYQVNGPGWQPAYRATLDTARAMVRIERQALIAQASGEDWHQVPLRLSTSQPLISPEGRPAQPWELRILETHPVLAKAAAPRTAERMLDAAPALMMAEHAALPIPQVFDGAFATEFEVPTQVTLPADGRQITIPLAQYDMPAKLRIQAVPRQDPSAFLVAKGELPPGVWLPGSIQLYRDGAYVGNTTWSAHDTHQLILPFGRDDLIRISVNHPQTRTSESGLIEQRRTRQLVTEYTIHNRHKKAIELTLLEPSPVSTDEKIKVEKRFEPAISQENWEEKKGVIAWEYPLAAGATQKFSTHYQISWPKEAQISPLR